MNNFPKRLLFLFVLLWVTSGALVLNAQKSQDGGLMQSDTVFTFPRPTGGGSHAKGATGGGSHAKSTAYRIKGQLPQRKWKKKPVTAAKPNPAKPRPVESSAILESLEANEKLGITLWRLRPAQTGDSGARLLTMGPASSGAANMVAERVGLETVFKKGEKVRISVESPRQGYLYIIDRELKKDNTVGDPYLIFPTLRTRGGDNNVGAGTVIEIPAQTDNPFYFDILPTDDTYAGELLTVMVSPTKIEGLTIGENPIKLSAKQIEDWENFWEGTSTVYELKSDRDLTYTQEEKEAGMGTRMLTQMSPSPQTLISVEAPKGKAFLVSFAMKVSN